MDFARQQRDPKRHLVGIAFVILFHAIVIYGLMTGLAQKAVEVIKKPVTAKIIQEIKPPPPPPPPIKKIELPKMKAPITPYVPPPDIAPPPQRVVEAPVIQSTPTPPPPQPYVIAPPAPPAPPAPEPPPKPAPPRDIKAAKIAGDNPEYPGAAIRAGIARGYVRVKVDVDEQGNITNVTVVTADPPRFFAPAVLEALKTWKLQPFGQKYTAFAEFNFTLKD